MTGTASARSSRRTQSSNCANRSALWVLWALSSCQTATTRPGFGPIPGSATAEVRLNVREATQVLAEALQADSIPVKKVVDIDGVIESNWFTVPGYAVMSGRPLGPGVVRVRAWVDVGKPGHSIYTVEAVYRAYADPSREERELEQPIAENHPARLKLTKLLDRLVGEHGDPTEKKADTTAKVPAAPVRDTTRDTTLTIDN